MEQITQRNVHSIDTKVHSFHGMFNKKKYQEHEYIHICPHQKPTKFLRINQNTFKTLNNSHSGNI